MSQNDQTQPAQAGTLNDAKFRLANRRYSMVATVAIGLVLLLMSMYTFMVTHAVVTASRFPLGWIVNWLPAVFYLWALWQLRGLFAALSKDTVARSQHVATVVGRVGWALMLGAVATLVPLINFFANQTTRGGTFVVYLVPAITLFLLGLALIALAPMLNRAIALEAEAKLLKAELDGFF
jgi:cation transport ATPase